MRRTRRVCGFAAWPAWPPWFVPCPSLFLPFPLPPCPCYPNSSLCISMTCHAMPCLALACESHACALCNTVSRRCLSTLSSCLPTTGAGGNGEEQDGLVTPRASRRGIYRLRLRVAFGGVSRRRRAGRRWQQVRYGMVPRGAVGRGGGGGQ